MSANPADRLATAAWAEMKDSPYTHWSYSELPARAKARVDRTVAAVLRELAADCLGGRRELSAQELLTYADEVERGENR